MSYHLINYDMRMVDEFILIPGRSSRQGVTLNEGKYTEGYIDETSILRMNPDDMQRLGVSTGDDVRMWNEVGEVVVPILDAKDECPPGLVFICYGDKSSQLMGGETHGSGMPDSKGLDVYVQPASLPKPDAAAIKAEKAQAVASKASTTVPPQPIPTKPEHKPAGSAPATSNKPTTPTHAKVDGQPKPVNNSPTGFGPTLVLALFILVLIGVVILMNV